MNIEVLIILLLFILILCVNGKENFIRVGDMLAVPANFAECHDIYGKKSCNMKTNCKWDECNKKCKYYGEFY